MTGRLLLFVGHASSTPNGQAAGRRWSKQAVKPALGLVKPGFKLVRPTAMVMPHADSTT